jgi:hypothetical protein
MAGKRKPISKKIRFEVFKRDKFTCQYCGRSAPDVILEVDHIKPVSKGGENNLLNYITSCYECNRGKGARELSDDSLVKKQQRQLQELAEKNEQLQMILKWREELQNLKTNQVDSVNHYIGQHSEWMASEIGKKKIIKWLNEFPFELILEAVDISFEQYYDGSERSWNTAFNKIGGICANKSYDKDHGNKRYYYNYIAKSCREKYGYWDSDIIHYYVENYICDDEAFEKVKSILKYSRYWSHFKENIEEEFDT